MQVEVQVEGEGGMENKEHGQSKGLGGLNCRRSKLL
jgi:hypothetical protein